MRISIVELLEHDFRVEAKENVENNWRKWGWKMVDGEFSMIVKLKPHSRNYIRCYET